MSFDLFYNFENHFLRGFIIFFEFVSSGTGKLQKSIKAKKYRLADRGLTCDFLKERSVEFWQSFLLAPPVGAELANWPPLAHSSWVKCGFPTGRPEGCILSAKTETKPY